MTIEYDRGADSAEGGVLSRLLDGIVKLRRSSLRERIPRPVRTLGYKLLPGGRLEERMWRAEYEERLAKARKNPIQTDVTIGIIKDYMFKYGNYEAACMELGVPHKLIDITGPDWIEQVVNSDCDAFVVWPAHVHSVSKTLFDERLKVVTEDLGEMLFPSYKALWLYDSKRRVADWLRLNDIPRPRTWVFFSRAQALDFLTAAEFPLVFKTDLGSSAHGVEIVHGKNRAVRLIKTCFGKGYLPWRHDRRDRSWGYVLFQEFIPDAREWRMLRVGDSFFGYRKGRIGDFHSGTHLVEWDTPPSALLNLCRDMTNAGPFLSMSVDVLESPPGKYFVSEFHPVWGAEEPSEMYVDGKPGRFTYEAETDSWNFEDGCFCHNASCNLRLQVVFDILGKVLEPVSHGIRPEVSGSVDGRF